MAYYKRSAVLLPVYILAALFSAALMNVVRIVVIAISQEWWQFDLAHGWLHDLLGYTCLAFAILLLFSFDRLFFVFFFPIRSNAMPIRLGTLKNPLQLIWNFLFTTKSARRSGAFANDSKRLPYPIIGYTLFATLFTYQIAFSSVEIVSNVGTILAASKSDETVDEGWRLGGDKRIWNTPRDLFDRIASIKVESYENKLDGLDVSKGQFADIWQVTPVGATIDCRLAISQPYNRFHDLTTCYTGVGWNIVENKIVAPSSSDNAGVWPLKYSSWETPQGLYGYLTYSGITIDAEPIVVEEISFVDMLKRRFGMNSKRNLQDTECLMFQIWVTSTLPLSAEQVNSITKLHFELEKHVLTQMRKDLGK
jgi:exosortase/archaeosortase family protein